jgi:hypothetical protein
MTIIDEDTLQLFNLILFSFIRFTLVHVIYFILDNFDCSFVKKITLIVVFQYIMNFNMLEFFSLSSIYLLTNTIFEGIVPQ